jgi:hypothetical protein
VSSRSLWACFVLFALGGRVAYGCGIAPPNLGVANESNPPKSGKPVDSGVVFTEAGKIVPLDAASPDSGPPAGP